MAEQSLAALAGHDEDARQRLTGLLERYRREGIASVRAWVVAEEKDGSSLADDLVEAVLTLAEQRTRTHSGRRDWEDFDRAEDRDEREREARA